MNTPPMTCDRLDELLPDFLESALGADDTVAVREHAVACERCAALIEDLTALRDETASLPALQPSHDLWPAIAERIAAPVVALSPSASTMGSRRWSATRIAAAAAALVAVTAGVTYQATRQFAGRGADIASASAGPARVSAPAVAAAVEPDSLLPRSPFPAPRSPLPVLRSPLPAPRSTLLAVSRQPAEATFEREVVALRRILDQRRASLDPATLEILERNMHVIDAAIAESRAALARDPASNFLNQQLNSALDKKLELMRTTAMLPSRT